VDYQYTVSCALSFYAAYPKLYTWFVKVIIRNSVSFFTSDTVKSVFRSRHNYVSTTQWYCNIRRKFLNILIKWILWTTRAKNYENIFKFVKDMSRIPWSFFSQTRCIYRFKRIFSSSISSCKTHSASLVWKSILTSLVLITVNFSNFVKFHRNAVFFRNAWSAIGHQWTIFISCTPLCYVRNIM